MAAADRVIPASAASARAAGLLTRQIDGYEVTPAASIVTSTTRGALPASAIAPASRPVSSATRSSAQDGSAVLLMIRSVTSRVRRGRADVSTSERRILYDSASMGCTVRV